MRTTDLRFDLPVLRRRALGRIIDVILWAVFFILLAMPTGSDASGKMTYPMWVWIVVTIVPIGYETLMVRRAGRTVGKLWSGVKVTTLSGGRPSLLRATVRAAITWPLLVLIFGELGIWVQVPALITYVTVFAVALGNSQRRGLHDFAAGTVVSAGSST